jgi:hypothetical protein
MVRHLLGGGDSSPVRRHGGVSRSRRPCPAVAARSGGPPQMWHGRPRPPIGTGTGLMSIGWPVEGSRMV